MIHIATVNVAGSSSKLTDGKYNDHSPAWHPDGRSIIFLSDRVEQGKRWGLYSLQIEKGLDQETDALPKLVLESETVITSFLISPDGKSIAYVSEDKPVEKEDYDVRAWGTNWSTARLRVMDLASKQVRSLQLDRHIVHTAWSPDSSQVAVVSAATPELEDRYLNGTEMVIVDAKSLEVVKNGCMLPRSFHMSFFWRRNGTMYLRAGAPQNVEILSQGRAIYKVDPNVGTLEWQNFGVENDTEKIIHAGDQILAWVEHRLDSRICTLDGRILHSEKSQFESCDARTTSNRTVLAFAKSSIKRPVEVFSILNGGDPVQLSRLGDRLQDQRFGEVEILTFPSDDGETDLDALYLVPGEVSSAEQQQQKTAHKPLPTIVLIHGGPHGRCTISFNTYYYMIAPYLLSLGYGVLIPNYRGSSARGSKFASLLFDNVGKHDYDDVIKSTDFAIRKGYADHDKLIVCGVSHGALLALCAATRNGCHGHDWTFKASILVSGWYDADTMASTSDMGAIYLPEYCSGRAFWNMYKDDTRNRQLSPLWEIHAACERSEKSGKMVIPPILIIHGEADTRCSVTHAHGLRRALMAKSLPFELYLYPGQGHIFQDQKYWLDMLQKIGNFCDIHIGRTVF